ncbi:hypothetical protein QYE76_067901 [Lolium multiflorum]|uniref:Uncharacterized protein n=1 Tax=Lolium multiflorum TaxID=4521 RepID=A0AAD8SES4_LOLMU|nr:hypothetical protein QYE76_067901 [Lolium multiflorum]
MWKTHAFRRALGPLLKQLDAEYDIPAEQTDDTSSGEVEEVLMPSTTLDLATSKSVADKAANLATPTAETQEPITSSSAVPLVLGEGYDLSSLLTFDPESIEPATSKASEESGPSATHDQLQHVKALLSSSIETLEPVEEEIDEPESSLDEKEEEIDEPESSLDEKEEESDEQKEEEWISYPCQPSNESNSLSLTLFDCPPCLPEEVECYVHVDSLEIVPMSNTCENNYATVIYDNPCYFDKSYDNALFVPDVEMHDPEEVKSILEDIQPHLPVTLQVKLWPVVTLSAYRSRVKLARQRISLRHAQLPLKADIADKCQRLNEKKAALDAKTDTSVSTAELETLRKELEDLEERVRATKQLIQDKEALIAHSHEEAEGLKAELKTDLAEIRALNKQLVTGQDEDDEAEITEVDRVRANALHALEAYLQ